LRRGVTGAATARDDRELELDQCPDDIDDLVFAVRVDDDKRILDPPVGRIGDMRDTCKAIKLDIVGPGDAREPGAPRFGAMRWSR